MAKDLIPTPTPGPLSDATEPTASILLVDDNPANLLALRSILEDLDQNLVEVRSGEEALVQLRQHDFAVVLLDVQMPGLNGFATAKLIREQSLRHIPIIFLTAFESDQFLAEKAYSLGAVDYLVTPLVPVIVRAKVAGFVELFQKTQQIRSQGEQLRNIERQRFDRSVGEQQEWFRVTLSSIGDAVLTTDTQGLVTFLNPVAQDLTGWTDADAKGRTIETVLQILHEQTRQPVENPVAKVLKEGRVIGLGDHTVLVARDGTGRPIDHSAAPIRNAAGEMIGVVLIFRDVTEQRRAVREVRQSEARKTAILETALDCIITMDHEGKVVEFNPAAEKTFGYSRGQVVERMLADFIIPPSLRERHRRGMAHYLATGEGPALGKRLELSALRADGTEFPVELSITRIATDGPPLFTAYLRDISEPKRAEQRRNARLAVTHVLSETATMEDKASGVLQAVCENLGWDVGFFWIVNEAGTALACMKSWHRPEVAAQEFEATNCSRTFEKGEGLPGRVWASQSVVWIPDLTTETEAEADVLRVKAAVKEDMRGAFGFPIHKGTEFHGIISFFSREIQQPDEKLIEMMNSIGSQISQFIDRKTAKRRLVAEHAISGVLAASDTLNDAASNIIQTICECLDWDVGVLWVVDRNANVLRCVEVWHKPMVEVPAFEENCRQTTYSDHEPGLPSWIWATKLLAWFPDLKPGVNAIRWPIAIQEGLHAGIGFPITNGIEFFGVLEFFSRKIRQPDEELMEMMNSISSQISQFIDRRRAQKVLHRQEVDRRIARQIQQGLLPKAMPKFAGYNISGRSTSADEVGGDSFDFIPLLVHGQECLDVVIADVSGHGIAAALLAGQTRAYLRAFAFTYWDVGTLLTLTNRRLVSDLVTEHFITLLLVQLDSRSRSLRYTSAGHCPGYVLDRQGQIKAVLDSTGTLLGIDAASEFPTGPSLTLEPGELIFLYTDGIVEARSLAGKPFGLERTLDIVRKHQQETPDEILGALFDAVGVFSEHSPHDDLTAVIIKAEGAA